MEDAARPDPVTRALSSVPPGLVSANALIGVDPGSWVMAYLPGAPFSTLMYVRLPSARTMLSVPWLT